MLVKAEQVKTLTKREVVSSPEIEKKLVWTRSFDDPRPFNIDLLGGKGLSLVEMTRLGLPVPPGFILTTDAWHLFNQDQKLPNEVWQEILDQLTLLEEKTGEKFADGQNPLVVSVRSGAHYSMPGMMETILNIGINEVTGHGLARQTNESCANDSYQRLRTMFERVTCKELPQDPYLQLRIAIEAVLNSWNNPRASVYRELHKIPFDIGTAVTIQKIVFGNADSHSGAGVFFTRNPQDGKREMGGEFVRGGQGEVVSGRGRPMEIPHELADQLAHFGERLERYFCFPQDIEFTEEKGKIWLLQGRNLKGTPLAKIRMAIDMANEGLITFQEAYRRVGIADVNFILHPGFDSHAEEEARKSSILAKGKPTSVGTTTGVVAFTPEDAEEFASHGKTVILVCPYLDPNNMMAFRHFQGLIASEGGTASHLSIILQAMGKVSVVGVDSLSVKKGEIISLDGNTGEIFRGEIPLAKVSQLSSDIYHFIEQRKRVIGESPWLTALYSVEEKFSRDTFLKKIEELKPQLAKWPSGKAQTVVLLNALLPSSEIIPAVVLSPDDLDGIRHSLQMVACQKGRQNIPRTCHHPEKLTGAPYVVIPGEKEIDAFLNDSNFMGHPQKYGGLVRWKQDPTLVGIIIPAEPEGKIDPELASEHFSFTISCLPSWPPKIVVDLNLGTPLLRQLEHIKPDDLIQIVASLNPEASFSLGDIEFNFSSGFYHDSYAQKVANLVADKVFYNWWRPPFSLPHAMSALDSSYGLSILEGQGRMQGKENLLWCLIYGAKGREEKEKVKEAMS